MSAARKLEQLKTHSPPEKHDDSGLIHTTTKKGDEGEGPWLVSYADLMTLLMGFFALVSSMSTPDQKKFEKVREAAVEAFGGSLEKPYEELGNKLQKFIDENNLKDQVQVKVTMDGVEMTFTGTLFFDSGDYVVKEQAQDLMERLAQVVKQQPQSGYRALIEGHTDSIPISHPIIASNWELSGLRASRIAQIFEANGFSKDNLTIIGWGETKPLLPDTSPTGEPLFENRAKNRRVVIRVYDRKYSNDPIRE